MYHAYHKIRHVEYSMRTNFYAVIGDKQAILGGTQSLLLSSILKQRRGFLPLIGYPNLGLIGGKLSKIVTKSVLQLGTD